MSINGFDFPKVTLRQEFQSTGAGSVDELGVVCVGRVYEYSKGETDITTNYEALLAGVDLPLSERIRGVADISDAHFNVRQGIWKYKTGIAAVIEGVVEHDDDSDGSVSSVEVVNEAYVEAVDFDGRRLGAGDWLMIGTGASAKLREITGVEEDGTYGYVIRFANDANDPVDSSDSATISLCLVANYNDVEVSSGLSFTASQTTGFNTKITLTDGSVKVASAESTWHSEDLVLVGLTGRSDCGLAVRYRAVSDTYSKTYGAVASLGEVEDVLGPVCANNPVALGCYFALAAGAGTVYFIGVKGGVESRDTYTDALDYLNRYTNMYSIVPCTENEDCIRACAASVESVSNNIESKVWRTLWYGISCTSPDSNRADEINSLLDRRYTSSLRAQCVWADGARFNGESLDGHNYALAAAAAGMRAGQPCHRPLSNLSYSVFSIDEPHGFTSSDLKRLGSNGIWIIANNEDGVPINMRQVTTAVANNLNEDEESIVANADNVAISLCQVGRELVGCSNINPDLLLALETAIRNRLDLKTINRYGAYIGPQLLEWSFIRAPYQDPVNLDHVLAEFSITPPKPFNQFHMTLVVI